MNRSAPLDHQAIAARVPHAGAMCLLDRVVSWDDNHIECTADGSATTAVGPHPLARSGRLPATAAIEYAAQAMALHGRLVQESVLQESPTSTDGQAARRGFLAGLRSVRLHCRWIADASAALTVRVERFAGDEVQVLYDFDVRSAATPIAQGRAVVVLDAGARAQSAPDSGATRSGSPA
jgi:predicted hotdog family 3-hydroxylacyl-ACP dehydratase